MPRYFFHIDAQKPYRDETGETHKNDRAAWRAALRLARDIEDNLAPGNSWALKVCRDETAIYSISVRSAGVAN
jgi:hypothetical protein